VAAADRAARVRGDHFEKDGFIWVGDLGLRFGEDGHLAEVARGWDYGANALVPAAPQQSKPKQPH
jgi:hypothetical protein